MTLTFGKISNAHDILSDEKSRARYDLSLSCLKAAWEAQQAKEAKQQRHRQSAQPKHSHKIAELERKKTLIENCIRRQQEEYCRLMSLWDKLHSGEIPEGFEGMNPRDVTSP